MLENQIVSVIIDPKHQIFVSGMYSGSIFTKLKNSTETIIFSDNAFLNENEFRVKGLHINLEQEKSISEEKETILLNDLTSIEFCLVFSPEVVKEFDAARFSSVYPNIVRFLHTSCLYLNRDNQKIDHMPFVINEILNRPVAVGENIILIGDRVVIEDNMEPIFYDCIIIQRDQDDQLKSMYDPFVNISLQKIHYIILLGVEEFE